MSNFINYLLESGISLSFFAVVYFLFLRRETFFIVNRWFLLASIGFSSLLPLIHIPVYASASVVLPEVTITPYVNLLNTVTVYGASLSHSAEALVLNYKALVYFYLAGIVFFGITFLFRMYQINRLIKRNQVVEKEGFKMVILDKELTPFSFLNFIFVSRNLHNSEGWEKMLEHEKQHIHQGHTFDVLVLEVLAVFQWFNPFFWLFRRALRENHEFLADQAVISHGTAPARYKQILLNQYVGDQIVLANNFNYSLIKIRMKMISKIKSKRIAISKALFGVLMAACLMTVFAFEKAEDMEIKNVSVKSEQTPEKVYTKVDQMPEYQGGYEGLVNFIATSVQYPEEAKKKGIQGKVYVEFVVDKEGSVKNAKITKRADPMLDTEALRVVNSMPKWIPGKDKGKEVAVLYTLPINFALK